MPPASSNAYASSCPGCGRLPQTQAAATTSLPLLCRDCLAILRPNATRKQNGLCSILDECATCTHTQHQLCVSFLHSVFCLFLTHTTDRSCRWLRYLADCTPSRSVNGLFQISQRCLAPSCEQQAASGGPQYCASHGGGVKCGFAGCDRIARPGGLPFCRAHGGGPRCQFPSCLRKVRDGCVMPFCAKHGGEKRCAVAGCSRAADRRRVTGTAKGISKASRGGVYCAKHVRDREGPPC